MSYVSTIAWRDTADATYAWHIDAHLSARLRSTQVPPKGDGWAWSVDTGHRAGRPMASGVAATREEAKAAMLGVMNAADRSERCGP